MSRLKPLWLLLIVALAALSGLLVTVAMLSAGHGSPVLPSSSLVTLTGVGLVVLILGIIVRRDQQRLRRAEEEARRAAEEEPARRVPRPQRRIHPLHAVRVVAAAQACAYAGALIAGWHLGVLIDLGPAAGLGAPSATNALLMIIGGMMWVIIGFVVEQMCRIPPDDDALAGPEGTRGGLPGETGEAFGPEPGTARIRDTPGRGALSRRSEQRQSAPRSSQSNPQPNPQTAPMRPRGAEEDHARGTH